MPATRSEVLALAAAGRLALANPLVGNAQRPAREEVSVINLVRKFVDDYHERLDDGKFQAEIKFLDNNGKMETQVFTAEKNLPAEERNHILSAIEHPQQIAALPDFDIDRDGDFEFQIPFPQDFLKKVRRSYTSASER